MINSWVSAVFYKIREKNFNPITQEWGKVYELEDAKKDVLSAIKIGALLKDAIDDPNNFGVNEDMKLDLISDDSWGIHSRNLLNTYAHIAQVLKDKGFVTSDEEAVNQVVRLLPGGELGKDLLESIKKLYKATGTWYDEDYFKTNRLGRDALANFTSLITEFTEYPNYYGLKEEVAKKDLAILKDKRVEMVDLGLDSGLVDLIKDYLGLGERENLDLSNGEFAGVYTFWNKVLFAAVNNLGKERGGSMKA